MFISTGLGGHSFPFPDEEALRHYPGDHPARKAGDTVVLFSNRFFDAGIARDLFEERIVTAQFAEEMGFDGIIFSGHQSVPWSLVSSPLILAAFIAANTSRIKIAIGEVVIPYWDNPVRHAEELAMLDIMSGGRLEIGLFRGAGHDAVSYNVNPAYIRDRFAEAHDLLVKTWTEPGPFRWEGDHYQFRAVNPWVLPMQKPFPRIEVLARSSTASARFAALHGYPVRIVNSSADQNVRLRTAYAHAAEEAGFEARPHNYAMSLSVAVAETEKEALQIAENSRDFYKDKAHNWGDKLWSSPTGYNTRDEAIQILAIKAPKHGSVADRVKAGTLFVGNSDQIVEQVGTWLEVNRPGSLNISGHSLESLRILGEDVLPRLRKIGDQLGLKSPHELDAPMSLTDKSRNEPPL